MNKILKTSAISLVGFGLALSVLAQTPAPTPTRSPNVRDMRKEGQQEMKGAREEFRAKVNGMREDLKGKIEAKRATLKEQLKRIKDERKRQVVERLDKRLDEFNERMTDHFVDALDQLDKVLERIDERMDRAEEKGVNVSLVRTAVEAAHQAITDARTAVETQAGKTYVLTVTTETRLKGDVGKARQALHADLKAVRERVKTARDAVHEAARAFAKAHGRDLPSPSPSPTASSSPSPTPTPTETPLVTPTPTP